MYNGLEVDVLSLGDADCSIVTQWNEGQPHRVLIDGGCAKDADTVIDFLRQRGFTNLWAAVCTHKHNDHASGLIKIVQSRFITITNGWMHDIRKHVNSELLKRKCSSDSGVAAAVETTRELAAAFSSRNITVRHPFQGDAIAGWPNMVVLGPTRVFYEKSLRQFMDVELSSGTVPSLLGYGSFSSGLAANQLYPSSNALTSLNPVPGVFGHLPSLSGVLARSAVKVNPRTQPFNSTSVILGIRSGPCKILLTADAGSEALAAVSSEWNGLTYLGVPHHGSDGNLSQSDIERFRPQFAVISAKGDMSHPSRSIVNALTKIGAKVASTHKSGNIRFHHGLVPARSDYSSAELLKGSGAPDTASVLYNSLANVSPIYK